MGAKTVNGAEARTALVIAFMAVAVGCAQSESGVVRGSGRAESSDGGTNAQPVFDATFTRVDEAARAIDSIFQPIPLLSPSQEDDLRRFLSERHLERARALGIERGLSDDRLAALQAAGELVRIEDNEFWIVDDLDYSEPLVVPAVESLLTEIGERFQSRLADLGAPAFRFEISSMLRSASDQAALRRVNPNAALGESAHEYATTVDILYSAFSGPSQPIVEIDPGGVGWAEPYLRRYAEVAADRVAARRALELKGILGEVMIELQREGRVLVTLERQQPVFHITVGDTAR